MAAQSYQPGSSRPGPNVPAPFTTDERHPSAGVRQSSPRGQPPLRHSGLGVHDMCSPVLLSLHGVHEPAERHTGCGVRGPARRVGCARPRPGRDIGPFAALAGHRSGGRRSCQRDAGPRRDRWGLRTSEHGSGPGALGTNHRPRRRLNLGPSPVQRSGARRRRPAYPLAQPSRRHEIAGEAFDPAPGTFPLAGCRAERTVVWVPVPPRTVAMDDHRLRLPGDRGSRRRGDDPGRTCLRLRQITLPPMAPSRPTDRCVGASLLRSGQG